MLHTESVFNYLFIFLMPFLILSIFNILDINLPILRVKILSERWYDTFGLLKN